MAGIGFELRKVFNQKGLFSRAKAYGNKGTLRRARKELGAAALTVTEADDGTVTVSADDGTTCVLYANRPFAEWTCSCLAANNCRHIVRAILHYQAACSEPGVVEDEEPDSTDLPGQKTSKIGRASCRERV